MKKKRKYTKKEKIARRLANKIIVDRILKDKEVLTKNDKKTTGTQIGSINITNIKLLTPLYLKRYAILLNNRKISSEEWFNNLFKKETYYSEHLFNFPLLKYIPDVFCTKYKYVIEIDGSIHNELKVKNKDRIKDRFYKANGYEVIRITAYNTNSYYSAIGRIKKLRDSATKTVILRKRNINYG